MVHRVDLVVGRAWAVPVVELVEGIVAIEVVGSGKGAVVENMKVEADLVVHYIGGSC